MKLLAQQDRERRAIWKSVKTEADRKLAMMRARDDARGMSAARIQARDRRRKKSRANNFNRWT